MSDRDGLVGLARRSDKYIEVGDYGLEALEVNRRLTVLAPKGARHWFRLGLCLKFNSQPKKAREAFKRGLQIDPDYLVKTKRRSEERAQKEREQEERARRAQVKREQKEREKKERERRAQEKRDRMDREQAERAQKEHARRAQKEHDERLSARSEVAAVFEEGGREALRSLINYNKNLPSKIQLRLEGRRLLDRQPDADVWDRIGLAREVGLSGKHEEALGLYREAAGMDGPDARAAATIGAAAVFRRMKDPKRAEDLCRQVLELYPEDFRALTTLGAALRDQGHHEDAEAAFEAAERLRGPDDQ